MPTALTDALSDRYLLERELGHGGMATVYLARDLKHDREVAVKVLRAELAAVLGRERFLAEIRLVARLDHPHILTLIDSGEAGGTLYYVLPYIRGETLRQRLDVERQLPVEEAVRIGRQVAGALDYAHRQGVIHRDIKPENIMLHEGEAVVTDFGIALALREAAGERLTGSGLAVGTPQYMSPEQAMGGRDLTARSDLFSLGAVIYEMLTGEPPFRGQTVQAVTARLLNERPPAIRTVRATVPPGIEAAVFQALAKLPADRFASGDAFAAALGEGITPKSAVPVAADPGPGRRLRPAEQWLIGLAAVTAGIVLLWSVRTARESATSRAPAGAAGSAFVLVSPFRIPAGDTLAASVARSLAGAIVDSLANVNGLRVVATTDAGQPTPDTLLRGADISLIVAGSIDRTGNELKAVGRVSEAATGVQRFSHAERASPAAIQVLQADLVERIVRFVRRYVGSEVRRHAVAAGTRDAAARDYWDRATAIISAVGLPDALTLPAAMIGRLAVADSLLREAVRRDPRWIGPHVAQGWAYLESASLYGSEGQRDSARIAALAGAVTAANAALRIAPADPGAHELRGVALVGLWFEAPSEQADSLGQEAELELQRAISLGLNVARAWEALSTYYLFVGRFEDARQGITQALRADAFLLSEPEILLREITADLNLEHYADAQRKCDRGARWYPLELGFVYCPIVVVGWSASDLHSATRVWNLGLQAEDQLPPVQRRDLHRTALLMTAAILARAGHRDSAESLLRTFESTRQSPVDLDGFAADEAYVRLLVGQEAEAIALLKLFLHNNWSQRGYIVRTPWFRALHGNPTFGAITELRP